jgi:hypothetical protein
MSNSSEISNSLFASVAKLQDRLTELEESYKQQSEELTSRIRECVEQIARQCDTQATRAAALRDLYWKRKVSAAIIAPAFGLTQARMRKLAGTWTIEQPCAKGCGNNIKVILTGRSKLDEMEREQRKLLKRTAARSDSDFFGSRQEPPLIVTEGACEECVKRIHAEWTAEYARRQETVRRRKQQLASMSWEEFIETQEWRRERNFGLHNTGYTCELCRTSETGLCVCYSKDGESLYVVCKGCRGRIVDLIDPEKMEYVKREFITEIEDWNQEHY